MRRLLEYVDRQEKVNYRLYIERNGAKKKVSKKGSGLAKAETKQEPTRTAVVQAEGGS